jgi:tRNA (cmo5U34)-methyltransferase
MTGFDAAAATYDRSRHALLPDYDDLYGAAVEALALNGDEPARVLDLGAGTGGFSIEVVNADPGAQVHLVDVSSKMLEQARAKFASDERFSFEQTRYRRRATSAAVGTG